MRTLYKDDLTKIYNSYLVKDTSKKIDEIINKRKEKGLDITRSRRSYICELKAHNRFYKLRLFKKHTKNCDLEENIKLWKEIVYRIIGV